MMRRMKREDTISIVLLTVAIVGVFLIQLAQVGWWALLVTPLSLGLIVLISLGTTALMRWARRKDIEAEIARLEGRSAERRESSWSRLWARKRKD